MNAVLCRLPSNLYKRNQSTTANANRVIVGPIISVKLTTPELFKKIEREGNSANSMGWRLNFFMLEK